MINKFLELIDPFVQEHKDKLAILITEYDLEYKDDVELYVKRMSDDVYTTYRIKLDCEGKTDDPYFSYCSICDDDESDICFNNIIRVIINDFELNCCPHYQTQKKEEPKNDQETDTETTGNQ